MSGKSTGVGIIGLGFMGKTHLSGYRLANSQGRSCRLAAVYDDQPEHAAQVLDESRAASGTEFEVPSTAAPNLDAFFATPDLELISICTPTDTHVDLARRALGAGKHVLVEKPVALRAADVELLQAAAARAGRHCIPAMCMRFWPGWTWLQARAQDRRYGKLLSLALNRLGGAPQWSAFYADAARCGGALFDLHIHDVDFVYWLFGRPQKVAAVGTSSAMLTAYSYSNRHQVTAAGAWLTPGFPFRMHFIAEFETATAEFDSRRPAPLTIVQDGAESIVPLEPWTGWDGVIAHALDLASGRTTTPLVTLADAVEVTRILEAESTSLRNANP